jgi:predicted HTH domain antitoxin
MRTFDIDDLIRHRPELLKEAKDGRMSLLMENSVPVALILPFNEALLNEGTRVTLALKLFDEELISVGQAAEFAELPLALFMDRCSALGIPVVRYETGEVEEELRAMDENDHI